MVTKKASKPLPRVERRGRASALNAPRRRVHALAPEHVGELGSVAALAIAVLGVAVLILALALVVSGLTMQSRYATGGVLPPNIGQLGQLPLLGGIGLVVLSLVLIAGPLALLADLPGARLATIIIGLIAGILSVGGLLAVISRPSSDPVLVAALGITALLFGASALILARPGR
ncbi:MAG: hypothetical protein M3P14_09125 [Chloroflexota bacterium]|nr:hypothetical protein [Chloroflexota bacterium]